MGYLLKNYIFLYLLVSIIMVVSCRNEEYEMPANVTNFEAEADENQIRLSWTNPDFDNLLGIKILRKDNLYPLNPTDGTQILFNIGIGVVDTDLENGVNYYYTAYTYDIDYNYSSGVNVSAVPQAEPPPKIDNFTSTAKSGQIELSWENPQIDNFEDFIGVEIRREVDSCTENGNNGIIIYLGKESSHVDDYLTNGTSYCYKARTYDINYNYSFMVTATATPQAEFLPDVSDFDASTDGTMVTLTWDNPSPEAMGDFAGVEIRREIDNCPPNRNNGIIMYIGRNSSLTDTSVASGTLYCYKIFTYDSNDNYSVGVEVIITP